MSLLCIISIARIPEPWSIMGCLGSLSPLPSHHQIQMVLLARAVSTNVKDVVRLPRPIGTESTQLVPSQVSKTHLWMSYTKKHLAISAHHDFMESYPVVVPPTAWLRGIVCRVDPQRQHPFSWNKNMTHLALDHHRQLGVRYGSCLF